MKYGKFITGLLIGCCLIHISFADRSFVQRDDVKGFINIMVTQHNFNRKKLTALFENIKLRPEVIASMHRHYEAQPWYIYRKHFIEQNRIKDGVIFWRQHRKVLAQAEKQFGVPAKIIVAIIGVESNYGKQRGKYSVLDTLATISFDYPRRAKYFQSELTQFLLLSREQEWNPEQVLGSYAGAVGQPQFMPSSYRKFGVDYSNKRGHVDLFDNTDDIIGSVANYMYKNGWERSPAIYTQALITGHAYHKLEQNNRKPQYTLKELSQFGIKPAGHYQPDRKAYFFTIDGSKTEKEHWLGFNNFYVITRYNMSNLYALAVAQLANQIDNAYHNSKPTPKEKPSA